MPVCLYHDPHYIFYIRVWNLRLEKIAHAVYENRARAGPLERLGKFFRYETQIKTLFIRMPSNATETFGERFGVTVLAAGAYLGATPQGVPGCIGPLDFRMFTHGWGDMMIFIVPM
jgi:hypothetical protein